MNIQFYTRQFGNPFQNRQPDRSPEAAGSETVRPVRYDQATFHLTASKDQEDPSFARALAKSAARQITAQHSPAPDRIALLQKQVAEGTYQTDDMAIARAMFGR